MRLILHLRLFYTLYVKCKLVCLRVGPTGGGYTGSEISPREFRKKLCSGPRLVRTVGRGPGMDAEVIGTRLFEFSIFIFIELLILSTKNDS